MTQLLDKNFAEFGDIARITLENGMQVLHASSKRFVSASIRICVGTGSINEGKFSGYGLSHFAEHLAFLGAGKRGSESISKDASEIGAELNACTYCDRTVYSADLPSESLYAGLRLLSDMLFEPNFTEDSFKLERDVVLREIDMCADDADERVYANLFAQIYKRNPLRYPIIGLKKNFESVVADDVRSYFAMRYAPQNCILCVASNLSDEKFFAIAKQIFGSIVRPLEPSTSEDEIPQIASRKIVVYDNVEISKCLLAYRLPALESFANSVWDCAAFVLGNGNSSILSKKLKYDLGLVQSIDAEFFKAGLESILIVSYECDGKNYLKAKSVIETELKSFIERGLNDAEILKFIKHRRAIFTGAMRTSSTMAEIMSTCAFYGCDFAGVQKSAEDLKNKAKDSIDILRILKPDVSVFSALLPKKFEKKQHKKSLSSNITNIEVRQLKNGLRLVAVHLPDFQKVHLRLVSMGGTSLLTSEERGLYGLAGTCVLRDTINKTALEIADFAESQAISFYSEFSDCTASVCAESLPEDFESALELIANGVISIKVNERTFEIEKNTLISDILDEMDDPFSATFLELRKKYFGNGVLATSPDGNISSLKVAKIQSVEKIIRKLFCGENSVLVACGNIDTKAFFNSAENLFSKLKKGSAIRLKKSKLSVPTGVFEISKGKGKKQAVAFTSFTDGGLSDLKNGAERRILLEYLGGENGILFDRVRGREGLAYTASASRLAGIDVSMFYFYALSEPKKLSRIREIFLQTATELACGDFDISLLESARKSALAKISAIYQDPAEIAALVSASILLRGKIHTAENICDEISSTSLANIKNYAKKLFVKPFVFESK